MKFTLPLFLRGISRSLALLLKKRAGFTLIELIVAVTTLSIGIVSVLALFPVSTQVAKSAEMVTIATHLGQAKIEEIISTPYEEILSSSEGYGSIPDFEAFRRTTQIAYYDPPNSTTADNDSGIKQITVSVFWKSPLGVTERSINIASLITKR